MRRLIGPALLVVLLVGLIALVIWPHGTVGSSDQGNGAAQTTSTRVTRDHHAGGGPAIGLALGSSLTDATAQDVGAALDDIVQLHGRWVRVDVSWADVQPTSRADFRWDSVDQVIYGARQRGLKVFAVVGYTPAWAREPGCDVFACPPRDDAEFARFTREAATRFSGQVDAWEIWNEPNNDRFWRGPDPDAYGTLLAAAAPQVRAADPSSEVVLGGLAAADARGRDMSTGQFLLAACGTDSADRCRGLDGVGYHPYTFRTDPGGSPHTTSWNRIDHGSVYDPSLRAVMKRLGLKDLWVTAGAPTGGVAPGDPDQAEHVSLTTQARVVGDAVRRARADSDLVRGLFIYTYRDVRKTGTNMDYFGLRRSDDTRKPAWDALRTAAAD